MYLAKQYFAQSPKYIYIYIYIYIRGYNNNQKKIITLRLHTYKLLIRNNKATN